MKVDYYLGIIWESSNNFWIFFNMVNKFLYKCVLVEYFLGCVFDGDFVNKFIDFFSEKIIVLWNLFDFIFDIVVEFDGIVY